MKVELNIYIYKNTYPFRNIESSFVKRREILDQNIFDEI